MAVVDPLAQWLAQEQDVLDRLRSGAGWGVSPREQVAKNSGLESMQAMLRGELPGATMAKTLDFCLVEAGDGHVIFQGRPGPGMLNPMGALHGGWYATLLDSAMGCAVHTKLPAGRAYTTAELSLNLVKSVGPAVERVRAEGRVLHCGRQLATAEGKLWGPDGTLYAHGTTTCLVFEAR